MNARDATLKLLAGRARDATICPSEVARSIAGAAGSADMEDWRAMMPAVHAGVDQLLTEGRVRLSWKGRSLAARTGPYRIARETGGGAEPVSGGDGDSPSG